MENNPPSTVSPSEAMLNHIGQAIAELRTEVAGGFARVDQRLAGVDQRLAGVDQRLAGVNERLAGVDERLVGVDEQFAEVRQEIRDGDEQTRSQMRVLIDSVRDDVRIFAEAHVALEQRVTTLERRPR
jgi:archaellum component FlaC